MSICAARRRGRLRHVRSRRGVAAARGSSIVARPARGASTSLRSAARSSPRTCSASSSTTPRRGRSRPSSSTSRRPTRSTSSSTCSAASAARRPARLAPNSIERAARGDPEAIEEFLAPLVGVRDKYDAARTLLELDAEALKERLLDLLPRWYERGLPAARGTSGARPPSATPRPSGRSRARTRPSSSSSSRRAATSTRPTPGIRTLVFFPSWWMRPWVILWEHKSAKIFGYPIAPSRGGGHVARRARARLQGARRRGAAEAAAPADRGPAPAQRGGGRARRREVDRAPPPGDPPPRRLRRRFATRTTRSTAFAATCCRRPGELLTAYLGSSRSSATSA